MTDVRIDGPVAVSSFPAGPAQPSNDKRLVISTITVDIHTDAPGFYMAHALSAGVAVTKPARHDRIENAIREEASNIPEDFAYFVELTYGGMSTGTVTIAEAIARAPHLANRLVELVAEEHRMREHLAQ
jgi:hypothetical protein